MKKLAPAFTLVELLVVIALLAVLASLAYAGAGVMIGKGLPWPEIHWQMSGGSEPPRARELWLE